MLSFTLKNRTPHKFDPSTRPKILSALYEDDKGTHQTDAMSKREGIFFSSLPAVNYTF